MKTIFYPLGLFGLFCALWSCDTATNKNDALVTIDVRDAIIQNDLISIKDDVKQIEYIPLETTNESLISNPLALCMNQDYIFVYNGKNNKILQFDRTGKFIKQIASYGNGPGEYRSVSVLAIGKDNDQLYIFQYGETPLVYSFEGAFIGKDSSLMQSSGMVALPNEKKALKGIVMSPITISPWLVALQDQNGSIIDSITPFPQSVDREVCYMKEISFSPTKDGALAFTPCNDTIYRVSEKGIIPTCVLNRENNDGYYTSIADISKLQSSGGDDSDIHVFDFFETKYFYYFRVYKGEDIYIQRYSKADKSLLSQLVPKEYEECSSQVPGNNVIGISNDLDEGVPFWPEFWVDDDERAQLVTPYMIAALQEKGAINSTPKSLVNIGIDENPIIIVYSFK